MYRHNAQWSCAYIVQEDFCVILPENHATHQPEQRARIVAGATDPDSELALETLTTSELDARLVSLQRTKTLVDKIKAMKDFAAHGHFVPGGEAEYAREVSRPPRPN